MKTQKMTARDAAFQQFETLRRNREKRTKQRLFFLEGVHPTEHAIDGAWHFRAMGVPMGKRLSGWAEDMVRRAAPDTLYEIEPALHAELSDREEPCEILSLVEERSDGLARIARAENPFFVLFDRPQSPGNLGTIIRTADSFGASAVFTTGHGADFYDPQCIRASVGTMFHLPFHAFQSAEEAVSHLQTLPVMPKLVGTSARGDGLLSETDLSMPLMLLIGNEATGLSRTWKDLVDALCRIPICGSASSLNAACAASIAMYEVARQRSFH